VGEAGAPVVIEAEAAHATPRHGRLRSLVRATNPRQDIPAIDQLREGLPGDRLIGWIVTLVITLLGFFIRFVNFANPSKVLFDETYYAKDAWSLLQYGYEGSWHREGEDGEGVDQSVINVDVAQGSWADLNSNASFVVHPPFGKWLIASGEWLFGFNSFGWRFASVIFGTLLILMVIRLARRLSRSTLIGGLAGLFVCVDGLSFVMSRIALVDIFCAFFIVAGVAAVVADRDYFRNKLAAFLDQRGLSDLGGAPGPWIFRPWLIVAGVMFGLGASCKWSSMYALAVFGIVVVAWSVGARRLAGAGRRQWWALLIDGVPAFIAMVVVAAVSYTATWAGWFATSGGWLRDWGTQNPDSLLTRLLGPDLAAFVKYQIDVYDFHTGDYMAEATHHYQSDAITWPIIGRTVGIDAVTDIKPGVDGCDAAADSTCLTVIAALGTPLLWWAATIVLIAGLVWWIAGADWRFGVVVLATCSTWVPWFFVGTRPIFYFYAITMIPFMAIGLALALGVLIGPAKAGDRRRRGSLIAGAITTLIILDFAFIYPVLTDTMMTRTEWSLRMWFPAWI
jgi:dolichyl-phosphate-mannose--protein O-mannosyl transferase